MKEKVLQFIRKHHLLEIKDTVLVAVSGGVDSMALLHFLHKIKEEWAIKLVVVSIDHQLRGDASSQDLEYVRNICKQWSIPFIGKSINVRAYQEKKGLGMEIAAREVRYQVFQEVMEEYKVDRLALAHHADDQAETMLMRVTRSAVSSNLAGIPIKRPFGKGTIIRPFLCVEKSELTFYCEENGIVPRIDETNNDTAYTRNFFRKNVIPLIKEKNPNIHTTIQQLSETLLEDEIYLKEQARKMVDEVVLFNEKKGYVTFEMEDFKRCPLALQRRSFHLILNYLYKEPPKDISYIHEQQFLSLLNNNRGNIKIDFPSGLKLEKQYNQLKFYFSHEQLDILPYHKILNVPGAVMLPNGTSIKAEFMKEKKSMDKYCYYINSQQIELPLHIRTREPGDRMSWKGLNGSKKLKDIFIDLKIPKEDRDKWPIVVDNNGEIIWLIGIKKGEPASTKVDGTWIKLTYEGNEVGGF